MRIIKQGRPLNYSRGKHNAVKYRVFCVLTRAEKQLGRGVCLTTADIALSGGIPVANVRRLVGRWVRFKYLHPKGKRGKYVYGLLEKGRRFKRNADINLPRAREIISEIIAYQRAMGWIPPEPEPKPEPEREPVYQNLRQYRHSLHHWLCHDSGLDGTVFGGSNVWDYVIRYRQNGQSNPKLL